MKSICKIDEFKLANLRLDQKMVERDSDGPEQIYTAGADLQYAIDKPAVS